MLYGYKGFENSLRCRNFKYEIGKTFTVDGEIEICRHGLHFCPHPFYCFTYYSPDMSRYARVSTNGIVKADVTYNQNGTLVSLAHSGCNFELKHGEWFAGRIGGWGDALIGAPPADVWKIDKVVTDCITIEGELTVYEMVDNALRDRTIYANYQKVARDPEVDGDSWLWKHLRELPEQDYTFYSVESYNPFISYGFRCTVANRLREAVVFGPYSLACTYTGGMLAAACDACSAAWTKDDCSVAVVTDKGSVAIADGIGSVCVAMQQESKLYLNAPNSVACAMSRWQKTDVNSDGCVVVTVSSVDMKGHSGVIVLQEYAPGTVALNVMEDTIVVFFVPCVANSQEANWRVTMRASDKDSADTFDCSHTVYLDQLRILYVETHRKEFVDPDFYINWYKQTLHDYGLIPGTKENPACSANSSTSPTSH